MGNDGGTIARRSDILLLHSQQKGSSSNDHLDDTKTALMTTCAVSSKPLYDNGAIVSDYKGSLYLKEPLLEYIVNRKKTEKTEDRLSHIRNMGDLVEVQVSWEKTSQGALKCPVLQELKSTAVYAYLRPCGCVLLLAVVETAAKDSKKCPHCDAEFSALDIVKLNPTGNERIAIFNTENYEKLVAQGYTHSKKKKRKPKRKAPESNENETKKKQKNDF